MKLAVFGATGETGLLLVQLALQHGHWVTAFARRPDKLCWDHPALRIDAGELTDEGAIDHAVEGADAVISLLGPRADWEGKPITQGTKNILAAMQRHDVRRLVVVSTASARDPEDAPDPKFRLFVSLVKLGARPAYEDIVSTAAVVRSSDRDWTIVRVPLLTNGERTGRVNVGYLGDARLGTFLSRANMADFLLRQIGDTSYLRRSPAISNG